MGIPGVGDDVGYCDCACRDCFNGPIIGTAGVTMCDECEDAGCEGGEHECEGPHAYGGRCDLLHETGPRRVMVRLP